MYTNGGQTFLVLNNGQEIRTNWSKGISIISYSVDGISVSFDVTFRKYKFQFSAHQIGKKVYPKFTNYRIKRLITKTRLNHPRLKRKEN